MKPTMPCLGWLVAALAIGCAVDVEPETEDRVPVEYNQNGAIPDNDPGPPESCGESFELGPDGELVQVPVMCDPWAESLPSTGPEELYDERFLEHVLPPNGY